MSNLSATFNTIIGDGLGSLIREDYSLLGELARKRRLFKTRKDSLDWKVRVEASTVATNTSGATAVAASGSLYQPGTLAIGAKKLEVRNQFNARDMAAGLDLLTEAELRNQMAIEFRDTLLDMKVALNKALFLGDNADTDVPDGGLFGMDYFYDGANNYAGINRTTYPLYKPLTYYSTNDGLISGTSIALSRDLMSTVMNDIKARGGSPNLIVTSPRVYKQIEDAVETDRNFTVITQPGQAPVVDAGMFISSFRGVPILVDEDCNSSGGTSDVLYFLNTDEVKLFTQELVILPQQKLRDTTISDSEGLAISTVQLGKTKEDVDDFIHAIRPQLAFLSARSAGKIALIL